MSDASTRARDVLLTQEHRIQAALLYDRISWQGWDSGKHEHSNAAQHILSGEGDGSPFVQAIAQAHAAGRAEGIEEAAQAAYRWWDGEPEDAEDLRTHLRARITTPDGGIK